MSIVSYSFSDYSICAVMGRATLGRVSPITVRKWALISMLWYDSMHEIQYPCTKLVCAGPFGHGLAQAYFQPQKYVITT